MLYMQDASFQDEPIVRQATVLSKDLYLETLLLLLHSKSAMINGRDCFQARDTLGQNWQVCHHMQQCRTMCLKYCLQVSIISNACNSSLQTASAEYKLHLAGAKLTLHPHWQSSHVTLSVNAWQHVLLVLSASHLHPNKVCKRQLQSTSMISATCVDAAKVGRQMQPHIILVVCSWSVVPIGIV